eukprot:358811-Chlamydomonas_euryale.AAC.26
MVRAGGGGQGRVVRAGGRRRVLQRRWQVAHRAIAGCAVWRHRVHAVCAAMRRRAGPRGAVAHKAQRHLHRAALLALALVIHRNLLAVGAGGAHARERHAPHADSLVGEHHVSLHDGQRHIVLVDDVEAERLIPYRVLRRRQAGECQRDGMSSISGPRGPGGSESPSVERTRSQGCWRALFGTATAGETVWGNLLCVCEGGGTGVLNHDVAFRKSRPGHYQTWAAHPAIRKRFWHRLARLG